MVVIMKTYPEYKEHWENCCVEDLDHVETDDHPVNIDQRITSACHAIGIAAMQQSVQGGKYSKQISRQN